VEKSLTPTRPTCAPPANSAAAAGMRRVPAPEDGGAQAVDSDGGRWEVHVEAKGALEAQQPGKCALLIYIA
jgi:hypothetical protein